LDNFIVWVQKRTPKGWPITNVMSSKPLSWQGVLDKMQCDKVCQWLAAGQWFSLGTLVSSTNR
jgi:hypothetical protein